MEWIVLENISLLIYFPKVVSGCASLLAIDVRLFTTNIYVIFFVFDSVQLITKYQILHYNY